MSAVYHIAFSIDQSKEKKDCRDSTKWSVIGITVQSQNYLEMWDSAPALLAWRSAYV